MSFYPFAWIAELEEANEVSISWLETRVTTI
jgi:hypothetical protein